MASRSSRPKLERITYEDLMSSSGMSGFDALVRTDPADIQAALNRNPEFRATTSPPVACPAEPRSGKLGASLATVDVVTPVDRTGTQAAAENLATPVATGPVNKDPVATTSVATTVDMADPVDRPQATAGRIPTEVLSTPVITTPATEDPIAATPIVATVDVATPVDGANQAGPSNRLLDSNQGTASSIDEIATMTSPGVTTPVDRVSRWQIAWRTEDGKPLGPSQRVHRIQIAQDALSRTEEVVYDILWGPKNQNGDRSRLVSMGQSELSREARLTAKNAKLAVERLIAKGFVEIAVPANSMQKRQATQYRVFSYAAALDRMRARERTHVVRIVSGVFFVVPLTTPVDSLVTPVGTATVNTLTAPVAKATTPVATAQSTPVAITAHSLDICSGMTTTSEVRDIAQTLRKTIATVDDDVAKRLIIECRRRAPDATIDEITEFLQQKAKFVMRNAQIRNPTGFLLTAVPLCFEGESFRIFRQSRQEAKRQEKAEIERIAKAILEDQESSDEDRSWARGILADTQAEGNAAPRQ